MPAGHHGFVVAVGGQAEVGEKNARCQVARVGRWRSVGDFLAFEVAEFLKRAGRFHDGQQVVATHIVAHAFGRKRHGTGHVDCKACRAG